jgi:hypothetical protein
VRSSYRQLA